MTEPEEVPEGAAVMPQIPPDLEVQPLLLAVLHAVIFLAGSEDNIVHPDAAVEALEYMGAYLQRLQGPELERVRADLAVLHDYARQQQWPRQEVEFFQKFLVEFGVGEAG